MCSLSGARRTPQAKIREAFATRVDHIVGTKLHIHCYSSYSHPFVTHNIVHGHYQNLHPLSVHVTHHFCLMLAPILWR